MDYPSLEIVITIHIHILIYIIVMIDIWILLDIAELRQDFSKVFRVQN